MRYFNAVQAGRVLGISDKTIRRYIERNKIKAIRKESGELAIAESEVEKLRQEIEQERLQFGESRLGSYAADSAVSDTTELSRQVETLTARLAQLEHQQPELTVLTRELGKLQARCDMQQARIEELTRRIADLEAREYPVPPVSTPLVDETPKPVKPQIAIVVPSSGIISASEFAAQLGLEYSVLEGIMRHGIKGKKQPEREYLEKTEIPHPKTGKMQKYFNQQQREKAIEILRRHGKI